MKNPGNKSPRRGSRKISDLPLIGPKGQLTPEEAAAGFVIVDVPLTPEERMWLERAATRTKQSFARVVREAMRIYDIVSEEVWLFGNRFLIRDPETGEIQAFDFWPRPKSH